VSAEEFSLLVQPEPWMDKAACEGLPPDLFQMDQGQSAANAKKVCDTCSVSDECYEYGQRTGSVGVWGGRVLTLKRGRTVVPLQQVQDGRPARVSEPPSRQIPTASQPPERIAASRKR
jgi:hypothetical protein